MDLACLNKVRITVNHTRKKNAITVRVPSSHRHTHTHTRTRLPACPLLHLPRPMRRHHIESLAKKNYTKTHADVYIELGYVRKYNAGHPFFTSTTIMRIRAEKEI